MIRTIAAVFLLAAGIMTVACGDPEAQSQQAAPTNTPDSSYTPTGETTRLRVEAVESQIACDGETHDVRIWLDDLARDAGVYAVQAHLAWDPSVVWLTNEEDVRIAPGLADPAAEGPPFMLSIGPIDNTKGDVLFGVISFVTQATPLPGDPGVTDLSGRRLDPVAVGEPILLATIGLTAKAAGEVEVSLRDALLFEGVNESYGADEVASATIEVAGDCEPFATATPYPTATGQAIIVPPTEPPASTPAVVTPVPAAGVRDDCPQGWAVADERAFSFCYPSDLYVNRSESSSGLVSYNLGSPEGVHELAPNTFFLVVASEVTRSFNPQSGCEGISGLTNVSAYEQSTITYGGGTVDACQSLGMDGALHVVSFVTDIRNGDQFVHILSYYYGPDFDATRSAIDVILASLEVR